VWSTVCFRSFALHLGWYAEKHSSTLAPHHRGVQVFCVGLDVGRRVGGEGGRRRLREHVTHFFAHMSHTCPPPHATIVRLIGAQQLNRLDDCLSPTAGGITLPPSCSSVTSSLNDCLSPTARTAGALKRCLIPASGGAQVVRHEVQQLPRR